MNLSSQPGDVNISGERCVRMW